MARWFGSMALTVGLAAFGVACNTGVSTPTSVILPASTIVTTVSVTGPTLAVGATSQFTASATLSDGTTVDVTSLATWQTADTSLAVVSATGVVTGLAPGSVAVTATYQNVKGSSLVAVSQ